MKDRRLFCFTRYRHNNVLLIKAASGPALVNGARMNGGGVYKRREQRVRGNGNRSLHLLGKRRRPHLTDRIHHSEARAYKLLFNLSSSGRWWFRLFYSSSAFFSALSVIARVPRSLALPFFCKFLEALYLFFFPFLPSLLKFSSHVLSWSE